MSSDSIQLHLNSKYASSYDDETSTYQFNTNLIQIDDNYSIHLSVVNISIPYSFYNINSFNNLLLYQQLTTPVTNTAIYIPVGNYTAYQLVSYLNNNVPNTTVTYDSITNKITFTNSLYNFKILSEYTTCEDILGLSTNDIYNSSILKSLIFPLQLNLASVQLIKVATNYNSGSISNLNDHDMRVLCSFPVSSSPYSLITYTNDNNYRIDLNNNTFNSITIKILDQNEQPINFNGLHFSLTMQLDFINFVD
jgi:hypothetical protein